MIATRSIIRGSFRLSIVAAILAGAYAGIDKWITYANFYQRSIASAYDLATTLECGARLPEERLKSATAGLGLIDLSKVGCATSSVFASLDEIRKARDGAIRDELMRRVLPINYTAIGIDALVFGVGAFLLVNLLGFAFVGTRRVFRWVSAAISMDLGKAEQAFREIHYRLQSEIASAEKEKE